MEVPGGVVYLTRTIHIMGWGEGGGGYSKLINGLIEAASGTFSIQITSCFLVKPKEILLKSSRVYKDSMMQNSKFFEQCSKKVIFSDSHTAMKICTCMRVLKFLILKLK